MTEIEYEVREQDLIAFNEHQLENMQRLQKTLRRHQAVLPGVIALLAVALFAFWKDTLAALYTMLLAIAWGGGIPLYLKWNLRQQIRKMYSDEDRARILGKYCLRADPDALVEMSPAGESKVPWSDVLRVEWTKKHAFIFVGLDTALIVPRATVSKGNLHEFIKATDERVEQAG